MNLVTERHSAFELGGSIYKEQMTIVPLKTYQDLGL